MVTAQIVCLEPTGVSIQVVPPSCPGGVAMSWFGMWHALIPLHPPMVGLASGEAGLAAA